MFDIVLFKYSYLPYYNFRGLKSIGAVNVKVDLFDKLIHPVNSGTIIFGSMSMPINGNGDGQPFAFSHVDNPYDLYREVKGYIDGAKDITK